MVGFLALLPEILRVAQGVAAIIPGETDDRILAVANRYVGVLQDVVPIVRGTDQPEVARKYYEFVTSEPVLLESAKRFLRIPARTDLHVDSLPAWIRDANARIKPMPMDREILARDLDRWMKYWDANIRNQSRRR